MLKTTKTENDINVSSNSFTKTNFIFIVSKSFDLWLLLVINFVIFTRLISFNAFGSGDWIYWDNNALAHFKTLPTWFGPEGLGQSDLVSVPHVLQQYILYYLSFSTVINNISLHFLWFLLIPIFSNVSAWLFFYKISCSRIVAFFSTLFFSLNTEVLVRLQEGHNVLLFGYALTPAILFLLLQAIQKRRLLYFLLAGCILTLAFTYDLRTDFLMTILIGLFLVWKILADSANWQQRGIFYSKGLTCFLVVPIFLFPFFILPCVIAGDPALPPSYSSISNLETFSYADLPHALTLYDPFWPNPTDFSTKNVVPSLFLLLPLLAFVALWLRKRSPYLGFFALIYVVGVFLTKGANAPLGEVNIWIFTHIPGFFAFREATKFYLLVSFGLSFLVGVAIDEIVKFISRWKYIQNRAGLDSFITVSILTTFLAIFGVMLKPAIFQEIKGNFSSFELPAWQKQIEASQVADKSFYRTLWVPGRENISPFSDTHPIISAEEPSSLSYGMRPLAQQGEVASVSHWSYLYPQTSADLLRLIGVKYLYVPDTAYRKGNGDLNSDYMGKSPSQLKEAKQFLDTQNWLTPTNTTTNLIPAYKLSDTQDHFFIPKERTYVAGPDDFYGPLSELFGHSLASQAIVVMDEKWGSQTNPGNTVLFNQINPTDYVLDQLPESQLIEPYKAAKLPEFIDSSSIWTRNNLTSKYVIDPTLNNYDFDFGKGFIQASSNGAVTVDFNVSAGKEGTSHLWVRSLDNLRGSSLEITLDNQKLVLNVPETGPSTFHWHDLGTLNLSTGKHSLIIHSESGLNVINLLALVNDADFKVAQDKAHVNLGQVKVAQMEKFDSQASFKRTSFDTLVGNFSWSVPKSGQYTPSVHLVSSSKVSGMVISVDGQKMQVPVNKPDPGSTLSKGFWYTLPELTLASDTTHKVRIDVQEEPVQSLTSTYQLPLDYVILNEGSVGFTQQLQADSQPANLSYDYINPTKYIVHIKNASRPFDLVFSEAYDTNWGASYGAAKGQKPDKAYEMLQVYQINQTGSFDVTIEYRPQKYVYLGLAASAVGLVIVVGMLIVFWRKRW